MSTLLAKTSLLSPAELRFFQALKKALGRKYYIAIKVRVADLIDSSGSAWEAYGKKLSGMHIDFVLLRPKDMQIIACIELDDKSHQSAKAYERDKLKTSALYGAGIPLIRFPAQMGYDGKTIKSKIKEALKNV